MARTPEQRAFQTWFLREFVRQAGGEEPRPWSAEPVRGPRDQPLVTPVPPRLLLLAAAVGGAVGALLRYLLGELAPDGSGFPWTTFGINVVGSFLLALLPALALVRRRRDVAVALGPGRAGRLHHALGVRRAGPRRCSPTATRRSPATYLLGTLLACLAAVAVASRWTSPTARDEFAAEGGDE